ncbi:MAG TPA: transcription elongation factor [Opitutaceae bacterium]|nr:transcription elongation factor [Opitutaceae bacterium]
MNKKKLVDSIVHQLSTEMELIATAAKSAHDEATHDEELHKNQFETPGLETSVLAEGQVKVAAELREAFDTFRELPVHDFAAGEAIALGALVETELAGEKNLYFVGPKGGGLEVEVEGVTIFVITPHSPLGAKLIGRRAGDILPAPAGRPGVRIVSVL